MKLHKLIGLPGCGKTTLARKIVQESGNSVRVNRDDIRAMCFESKWTGAREKFVIQAEKAIARAALACSQNVVIDDTNLRSDVWDNFARENSAELVTHDLTDVPVQTCLDRDMKRDKRVGPGVIYRMAVQAQIIKFDQSPIIICDIDGTLADLSHRLHFIQDEPRNYEKFFVHQLIDAPYLDIIDDLKNLARTHHIVLMSGRPDNYSHLTVDWLKKYQVPYEALLMRRGGDHRPDVQVKQELLKLLPIDRIERVIDDRPSVIAMWKSHGLEVTEVHPELWIGKE